MGNYISQNSFLSPLKGILIFSLLFSNLFLKKRICNLLSMQSNVKNEVSGL